MGFAPDEDRLTQAIVRLANQYDRYDYRRLTVLLNHAGCKVSKDCCRGRPDHLPQQQVRYLVCRRSKPWILRPCDWLVERHSTNVVATVAKVSSRFNKLGF